MSLPRSCLPFALLVLVAGCTSFAGVEVSPLAGGAGGVGGSAGVAGASGTSGQAGAAGKAPCAGDVCPAGAGGVSGQAGAAGAAGGAGQSGAGQGGAGQAGGAGQGGKAGQGGAGQGGAGQGGSAGSTAGQAGSAGAAGEAGAAGQAGAAGDAGSAGAATGGAGGAGQGGAGVGGQTPSCGDGVTAQGVEECDDGNADNTDSCLTSCKLAKCGDGFVQAGIEECDDGNLNDSDGCTTLCSINQVGICGDGKLDPGEECDDGNPSNSDSCTTACKHTCKGPGFQLDSTTGICYFLGQNDLSWADARAACIALGPGFDLATPATSLEASRIQNALGPLGLTSSWLGGTDSASEGTFRWVSGDAWTYSPQEPPWIFNNPNNGASSGMDEDCVSIGFGGLSDSPCQSAKSYICERPPLGSALCRNGVLEAGEECDDGNMVADDGCNLACQSQACGDGKVSGDEACDDGNQDDLDACSNSCRFNCGGQYFTPDPVSGHCYYFNTSIPQDFTWLEARQACFFLGPGYDLIAPSTLAEIAFFKPLLGGKSVWSGGNDRSTEGVYTWSNGETWGYTDKQAPWKSSNPGGGTSSSDCIELESTGVLDDESCSNNRSFACERPALGGPLCRNGVLEAGEECDDGNLDNTDGCLDSCKKATCGDGFTRAGVEECDDGNQTNTDSCVTGCKAAKCGDTFVGPGEQCDDGNVNSGDGCQSDCTTVCGDGIVAGAEQCDDKNKIEDDGCTSLCRPPACGDGLLQTSLGEVCDDGNQTDTDACLNTCKKAACGDGVVQAGVEECDDGNQISSDACVPGCKAAKCGDGFLQAGVETCDDGNAVSGDGCEPDCTATQ